MRFSQCLIFVALALFATCLLGQVATTSSLDGTVVDPQGAAVAGAQGVGTNVINRQSWSATISSLDGTVGDPEGAAVAGAQVVVTNVNNGQTFKATTNDSGYWILPSMSNGVFKVGVTMQGFRTETVENVKIDAGVPTTANVKLELGSVSETVEVTGGAELVQTANATVNTTLEGRFVAELPEITRGGLDLLVASPGVQTAGANRNSSVNGLPNSALNVTLDGLNTQDQLLKSSNGFFVYIPITQDSIEEVTLTT